MEPSLFWKPFEEEIKSFDDLVMVINDLMLKVASKSRQFVWRGQVDADWALHSSLYRRLLLTKGKVVNEVEFAKEEARILEELRKWRLHSVPHIGRLSWLNQLAMLQHYGAPTRLIDITFNAWVAAWFAVERKWDNGVLMHEDKDSRLFAFDVTDRLINENSGLRSWEDSLENPWTGVSDWTTSVYAWKPANLDARIAAQNGGFLFGGVPSTTRKQSKNKFQFPKTPQYSDGWWHIDEGRQACCLAVRPHVFKEGTRASNALYTFRIKADAKNDIRQKIEKMFGYQHSTIYPDYTGFALFGTPHLKTRSI